MENQNNDKNKGVDEPLFTHEEMAKIAKNVSPDITPPANKEVVTPNPKPGEETNQNLPPGKEPPKKDAALDDIPDDVLPPKKPAEPAKDVIDAEKIKPEDFPETHRTNVANLRKQMIADQKRLKALAAKGITFEEVDGEIVVKGGTAENQEEFERIKARADELEARIEQTNLVESKSFQEKYAKPMLAQKKIVFDTASALLPEKFKDETARNGFLTVIDQLSEADMATRVAYLKKYFPNDIGAFIPLFQKIDEIKEQGNQAIANWKQTKELLGTQEKLKVNQQTREAKTVMLQAGLEDAVKAGYFMFKKTAGVDERAKKWNGMVDEINAKAASIFDSDDPKVQTEAMVRGVAAEYLMGMVTQLRDDLKKANETIQKYEVANPAIRGSGPVKPGQIPSSLTPAEAARRATEGI